VDRAEGETFAQWAHRADDVLLSGAKQLEPELEPAP
jgi:hypothetical protein